ncbi:MAG TPA: (2Fe-2S)-binding protein [Pseudonocardiaceae bacterium]|jgi:hypothetical protein|nr:(2Fe-2S)-binding protein [Pseudonocardiaceae bacterium]
MSQLGPLIAVLAEVGDWGPFFVTRTHETSAPPPPPWRPMRELSDDPDTLRQRVFAVRAYLAGAAGRGQESVPTRVAASVIHLGMVARLISPALGVAVHTGWFPTMDPVDLWWQPELGGAFPLSIGAVERGDPDRMITGAVRDLGEAVRAFSVSDRVLWGNVASAINGAATMIGTARPMLASRATGMASLLLEHPLLRDASLRRPDGRFQRRSCCLIYRASPAASRDAVCGDCVLQPPDR